MSLKCKRFVLSIKDKQSIIFFNQRKEKKEPICQEKIMKFADNLETSERLKRKSLKVAHDEQLANGQ